MCNLAVDPNASDDPKVRRSTELVFWSFRNKKEFPETGAFQELTAITRNLVHGLNKNNTRSYWEEKREIEFACMDRGTNTGD